MNLSRKVCLKALSFTDWIGVSIDTDYGTFEEEYKPEMISLILHGVPFLGKRAVIWRWEPGKDKYGVRHSCELSYIIRKSTTLYYNYWMNEDDIAEVELDYYDGLHASSGELSIGFYHPLLEGEL